MAKNGMARLVASTGYGPTSKNAGAMQVPGQGSGTGTRNASAGDKLGKGLSSRLTQQPGAMPNDAVAVTGKAAMTAARTAKRALNG